MGSRTYDLLRQRVARRAAGTRHSATGRHSIGISTSCSLKRSDAQKVQQVLCSKETRSDF